MRYRIKIMELSPSSSLVGTQRPEHEAISLMDNPLNVLICVVPIEFSIALANLFHVIWFRTQNKNSKLKKKRVV